MNCCKSNVNPFLVSPIFNPVFIGCLILFIVITPIGFSYDHQKLITKCEMDPVLYLSENLRGSPAKILRNFFDSANRSIKIVYFNNSKNGILKPSYINLLNDTVNRGVKITILTDNPNLESQIPFCQIIYPHFSSGSMVLKLCFAISDDSRTIFSSYILRDFVFPQTDFLIDFKQCPSVATDMDSFFQTIASLNNFKVFPHRLSPKVRFPVTHKFPSGNVTFGVSPPELSTPGRPLVTDIVSRFFEVNDGEVRLMTQALFPQVEKPRAEMPELLLSERIERAAVTQSPVRIIIPPIERYETQAEIKSLLEVPNVSMAVFSANSPQATIFMRGNEVGFMSMSFEYIVSTEVASISISIQMPSMAQYIGDHFNKTWENSTKI